MIRICIKCIIFNDDNLSQTGRVTPLAHREPAMDNTTAAAKEKESVGTLKSRCKLWSSEKRFPIAKSSYYEVQVKGLTPMWARKTMSQVVSQLSLLQTVPTLTLKRMSSSFRQEQRSRYLLATMCSCLSRAQCCPHISQHGSSAVATTRKAQL